jgi:hypothetical protein
MLTGVITAETPCHVYALASWHVFKQGWLESFIARRIGGFSIYREGSDRQALETSVQIVAEAERPLIVFPEGVISFANDRLLPLMNGTAFIARAAARKRAKTHPESRVVIHPVAYRYQYRSDPEVALRPVLDKLERMVFWQVQDQLPLIERIRRLGNALLSAREVQILGAPQQGSLHDRVKTLVDHILQTLEIEWLGGARVGDVISRVKDLRTTILEDMAKGTVDKAERHRRWQQLTDLYYAQCLSLYPDGYLGNGQCGKPTSDRLFETVDRIEEDMTDSTTIRQDAHVDINVGEAITVDPAGRRNRGGADPLMQDLRRNMLSLLKVEDWWPPEPISTAPIQDS